MSVLLRPVTESDHDEVLALNLAEVVKLAPMDQARLLQLQGWADRFDVIEVDGHFGGFVVTVAPGTAYDSENYAWFTERYDSFYYLDRVVLHPHVRRRGVGGRVYDELESVASAFGRLTLEVNLDPPNDVSLAFHAGRGYAEVGRLGDEGHLVSLMSKDV